MDLNEIDFTIPLIIAVVLGSLYIIGSIIEWFSSMFGGPEGEVPYEMIRASAGILCTVQHETGKMYVPIRNYVEGHFIAHNVDDYNDIIYLDEYFK